VAVTPRAAAAAAGGGGLARQASTGLGGRMAVPATPGVPQYAPGERNPATAPASTLALVLMLPVSRPLSLLPPYPAVLRPLLRPCFPLPLLLPAPALPLPCSPLRPPLHLGRVRGRRRCQWIWRVPRCQWRCCCQRRRCCRRRQRRGWCSWWRRPRDVHARVWRGCVCCCCQWRGGTDPWHPCIRGAPQRQSVGSGGPVHSQPHVGRPSGPAAAAAGVRQRGHAPDAAVQRFGVRVSPPPAIQAPVRVHAGHQGPGDRPRGHRLQREPVGGHPPAELPQGGGVGPPRLRDEDTGEWQQQQQHLPPVYTLHHHIHAHVCPRHHRCPFCGRCRCRSRTTRWASTASAACTCLTASRTPSSRRWTWASYSGATSTGRGTTPPGR